MTPVSLALTVLLAPLGSAAVIALFLRRQGTLASAISLAAALAVAVAGLGLALGGDAYRFNASAEWLKLGTFSLSLGI
jgi:NADH-quinone oxidoreductase subunit L